MVSANLNSLHPWFPMSIGPQLIPKTPQAKDNSTPGAPQKETEHKKEDLTSQDTTLLQVVHTLTRIALAQLLTNQSRHHRAHPLLTDNSITGIVHSDVVLKIDTLVGRGDAGLFREESCGLGGGHCGRIGC